MKKERTVVSFQGVGRTGGGSQASRKRSQEERRKQERNQRLNWWEKLPNCNNVGNNCPGA